MLSHTFFYHFLYILTTQNTFSQLGLAQPLLQAIEELGFEMPTPVQEKSIPVFLAQENDIMALAQTGTGKTAAFGLPLIQNLDPSLRRPQALVLSPTRELCMQIGKDLEAYSKYIPQLSVVPVYGGANIVAQIKDIKQGAQIIVATPGRLMDLIERKAIDLSNIKYLILDEADEMLNMGFEEDVRHILSFTPDEKRIGLFSATMPTEIKRIANDYLKNAVEISIGRKNSAQQNIEHKYSTVTMDNKYEALKRLLDYHTDFFGIIFCATKIQTQEVSDALVKDGYPADCLHGDLGQSQRDKVMNHFRHRTIKILLATDVAARGIDVSDLTHVLHFQLPQDIESYTHRSGRTARAGKKGISLALILPRDQYKLALIERQIQAKFEYMPIPKAGEVRNRKLAHFINTIANTEIEEKIFDETVENGMKELEQLDTRTLIMKMLSLELRRYSMDYLNSPDLNVYPGQRGTRSNTERSSNGSGDTSYSKNSNRGSEEYGNHNGGGRKTFTEAGDVRLFINIGNVDRIRYDEMREFLFKSSGVKGKNIKEIDLKDTYAFFNTDAQSAEQIYNAFKDTPVTLKNRALRVDYANALRKDGGSEGGENTGGGGGEYQKRAPRTEGRKTWDSAFSETEGGSDSSSSYGGGRSSSKKFGGNSKFGGGSKFGGSKFGGKKTTY